MRAVCAALGVTLGVLVPSPDGPSATTVADVVPTPVKVKSVQVRVSRSKLRHALEVVGRHAPRRPSPGTAVRRDHVVVVPPAWRRLVHCEAGDDWSANTGNGFYGGPQFTLSTWYAYGGRVFPTQASRAWQVVIGRRVLTTGWNGIAPQGQGAWPVCGPVAGLVPGS